MNKKLLIIVGIGVILIVIVLFFMDSIIALFTGGSDVQVTQNIQLNQQRRARQQQAQAQKAEEETEAKESEQTDKEVTEEQTSESSESEEVVEEKKEGENEAAQSENEEEEVKPEEQTKHAEGEKVEEQSSEEEVAEEEMEVKPSASPAIAKKEEQKSVKAKKGDKKDEAVKSEEVEESEESENASAEQEVQKPVIQPKPQPERRQIMEDDYDYSNSQFSKLNKYFKTKQYSQLLSEVDELVKNNNADGKILYLAGLAAYNTGDKEVAKRYFTLLRKNISTDNENNRHLYYWAKIYLEKLK